MSVKTSHLIRSTGILMGTLLVNKMLGVARQVIIAQTFGTGGTYDAYVIAFRLPEILQTLLAGGALATAFIPVLSERLTLHPADDPEGWRLTSAVLNTVFVATGGASVVIALLALPLVQWEAWGLAPGFSQENQLLTANLMRLVLVSTLIFSISGLISGVLNARQHFLLPALAPLIYNLGIIAGAIFLAPIFGIYGLTYGVIIGAAGHLLIQVPGLLHYRMVYQPRLGWGETGLRQVARLMGPRIVALGIIQFNFYYLFRLASFQEGGASALDYGWDLMQMPETIIGSAIGIVLFPTLSELAAQGNLATLRRTMAQALRIILALAMPAMVGLMVVGRPIIQLMFERGEFGPDSTALVYQSLLFWALALIPHCALEVVNRIFYAQKDTTTPLLGATLGLLIHAALAGALYQLLAAGGLALTNGIATAGEVLFLLVIAHRQLSGVEAGALLHTLGRTLLAAGLMGGAVLALSAALSGLSPLLLAATGGLLGVLVYIGAGLLLGVEEIRLLPQLVRR